MTTELQSSIPEFITRKELSVRLGISQATVYRHENKGILRGVRIGGAGSSVRYDWKEVLNNFQMQGVFSNAK